MLSGEEAEKYVSIYRFMIDKRFQGMGYGKEAMKIVLKYIYDNHIFDDCTIGLDVHRDNLTAINLFKSAGFLPTGEMDEDGEMEMELKRTE